MGNEWIMRACAQAEREGGRSMKHRRLGKPSCESRCPFGVPIAERMQKTTELFGR